jgi:hypothetical protein
MTFCARTPTNPVAMWPPGSRCGPNSVIHRQAFGGPVLIPKLDSGSSFVESVAAASFLGPTLIHVLVGPPSAFLHARGAIIDTAYSCMCVHVEL